MMIISLLNGAVAPIPSSGSSNSSAPPIPAQQELDDVEQLIDKAGYCYGVLEDYSRALKYLERAVKLAGQSYLKADALIKLAYVHFLTGKNISQYKEYIVDALKIDSSIKLERLYFKQRFINIFEALKKEPAAETKRIEVAAAPPKKEWKKYGKFYIKLNLGYLQAADESYGDLYGSGTMFPQVRAGFRMARHFYIWAGFGAFSAKGTIEEVNSEASSSQSFLFFGFNYNRNLSSKLGLKLEASAVNVSYKEEALDMEIKKSTNGFNIETGLVFNFSKRLFTELSAGYLYASDVVIEKKITLGGFMAGLGLGFKL